MIPALFMLAASWAGSNFLRDAFEDFPEIKWKPNISEVTLPGVVRDDAVRIDYNPLAVTPQPGGPEIGIFGRRRVGGRVILSAVDGSGKQHIVTAIAGAAVSALNDVYVDGIKVTRNASGYVTTVPWAQGNSLRVVFYDGTQSAADADLVAAFTGWTSAAVGKLHAYAHITIDKSGATAGLYDKGLPVITFDASGFKVFDPRQGGQSASDPATWAYSNNAVLCAATYLIHELGAKLPPTYVDWAAVATAATVADEPVSLLAGGTEARYTCAYVWTTDTPHEDVLMQLGAAFGGGMFLVGTAYRPYVAATASSTDTITPDDYVSSGLTFSDTPPLGQRVNGVRGRFSPALNGYEQASFPSYQDSNARAEDGRDEWLELPLDAVTSASQAQRLALIAYKRARFGAPASVVVNFGHFDTIAGDVVTLDDDYAGFAAAQFRVTRESVSAQFEISLDLVREFASYYDWTAATDEKTYAVASLSGSGGASGAVQTTGSALGDSGAIAYGGGALIDTDTRVGLTYGPGPGGATVTNNIPTAPWVNVVVKVWASPTTPAPVYRATMAYKKRTRAYTNGILTNDVTTNLSVEVSANGDIDFATPFINQDFQYTTGGNTFRTVIEYTVTSVTMRTEASAGSPATAYATLLTGDTVIATLNAAAEATSAYYVLPQACCPYTTAGGGLSYTATTNAVPGPRAATVELYRFTTQAETNRANGTLIGSQTNGGSMAWTLTGLSGEGFYYRAYAKTSGGVYGPASNPLLVIFQ